MWRTRASPVTLSAGPVWGLIGLMIAVLTRSSALAIGIGIGYLLVVESLTGIIAPDSTVYLPGGTLNALVYGGTSQLAWITALGLTIRYGIIAFIFSLVVFAPVKSPLDQPSHSQVTLAPTPR
jgi:hypothetical protein